ncbi:MAG: cysteine hydrolase [Xanthobacteraceae bacterium]|nr:cysteine hydrolase [Xanthobacteraceae bacterium]MCW5673881.1 cysteine hydrolase [Xanthobacteraceae bacterium]
MSTPKTLLQMAGASLEPGKFSESAVVIIDAQNEYLNGKLPLPGVEAALDNIAILLKAARAANAPIIHVQHKGRAGGLFDPGADAFKLAPQAANEPGEAIVEKPLPNSFAQTNLQDVLTKTGRKSLIVAGFMTHMCVSSTVRAALDLGYRTTVVADAAGTRDLPDPTGGPALSAAELHRAALAGLADRFAIVAMLEALKA